MRKQLSWRWMSRWFSRDALTRAKVALLTEFIHLYTGTVGAQKAQRYLAEIDLPLQQQLIPIPATVQPRRRRIGPGTMLGLTLGFMAGLAAGVMIGSAGQLPARLPSGLGAAFSSESAAPQVPRDADAALDADAQSSLKVESESARESAQGS